MIECNPNPNACDYLTKGFILKHANEMATHPIVEFPQVEDGARPALLHLLIEPRTVCSDILRAFLKVCHSSSEAHESAANVRWSKPNHKPYFAVRTIGGTIGGKQKRGHSDLEKRKRIGKDLDRSNHA